jgi:hypothetical protein
MYNNIITNTIFFTRLLKKLVTIPVLLFFCFACYHPRTGVDTEVSDTISVYEPDAVPFDQVDIKPQFNDRDVNDFSEWVNVPIPKCVILTSKNASTGLG